MRARRPLPLAILLIPSLAIAQPEEQGSESPQPLEVGADLFSRFEGRENYDALGLSPGRLGEGDRVAFRTRLDLRLRPVDVGRGLDASVLVQPQATGVWGSPSGELTDPAPGVHQGKLRLSHGGSWLDVGRFEMVYGEHLVIGNVGWHETSRSFDGLRLHGAPSASGPYLDVFLTMVREGAALGTVNPPLGGDRYFAGLYSGLGPLVADDFDLDGYVLFNIAPRAGGPMPQEFWTNEVTLGARSKKTIGAVTVRGEAGLQLGERAGSQANVLAYQGDADIMVALARRFSVGAGGGYASGDDPVTAMQEGWNQLYPTAHKFLGLMDVIGPRTNIAEGVLKARAQAASSVAVGLDSHVFFRPEVSGGTDSFTGVEADLFSTFEIGRGLALGGMYALFVPSESGPLVSGTTAHYVEVQLRYQQ